MVYQGYLSVGGNEVINNARVSAYAAALGITSINCAPCGSLARAVGDQPYTTPEADDAPWYDPIEPASARFAGVLGLEITGISEGVSYQSSVPLAAGGAMIAPQRRRAREVQARMSLLAQDECALSYGMGWIVSAVRRSACASDCGGTEVCLFTCCPPPCPDPPFDPNAADPCGLPYLRQLFDVGILTGPRLTKVERFRGGVLGSVELTFDVGNPYLWRTPLLLSSGPTGGQQLPDYTDPGVPPECQESADCLRDPLCPPAALPVPPPPVRDLCYPTGPFTARRWMIPIDPGQTPVWNEKVPFLRINPGGLDLRRLIIRWHSNGMGGDCATLTDPCSACAEVQIPYLPRNSWLTLDGRSERAWVDCPGGPGLTTASPQLYGRGGSPFDWPVFSCNDGMCLEIIALNSSVAPDLKWEISLVTRDEAA